MSRCPACRGSGYFVILPRLTLVRSGEKRPDPKPCRPCGGTGKIVHVLIR